MNNLSFIIASIEHANIIVSLVNGAYRGDGSRDGWTTEADLLGGQRTDVQEVTDLIAAQSSMILLGHVDGDYLGCVHLQCHAQVASLGMFAIRPEMQGQGIGKQFLRQSEEIVKAEWGARSIQMAVITLRQELLAYYERYGYQCTGTIVPFPSSRRFGIPKVDGLELTILKKEL